MRKSITLFAMVALFATSAMAQNVNVTFELNTANVANDPTGFYIAGGTNFGVPGDNPMTVDANDPNKWTITMSVPANTYLNYTFTNGNSGWGAKEDIAGLPCADAGNFNDRFMNVSADTTILACFGTCDSDGSCTAPPTPVNITFRVDMSNETVDAGGVRVAGSFQGWNDGANPMTDMGNGLWETTITINPEIEIEWKFVNGGWGVDSEQFDSTTHAACTKTTVETNGDVFVNRVLASTGTVDAILPTYIYGECTTTNTNDVFTKDGLFEINPTLVSNEAIINFTEVAVAADKNIQVINAVGQVVMNETVGQAQQYRLDATQFANGLYFVVIEADGKAQTARIMVNK